MAGPTMLMARSAHRAIDFEALAKGSSFGILVMDLHGTVISVNPQYASITGAKADALLGQSFPTLGCKTPERLHRSPQWRALVQCGQWSGKLPCQTPGSESGSMWLTLQKVDACDGRPTLVVAVCSMTHPLGWRDTELQRSEAARIASEQGWRFALEVAGDGVWDWNITTGEVAFSHNWKNMLGLGEDDIPPRIEEWTNRLMDEDRAAALATVDGVLKGSAPHFSSEVRMRCKDGSWKWVLARGMVICRDHHGKALRMIGTHSDLTSQKRAQEMIWRQTNFDPLTNLPNRRMMLEHVDQALKQVARDSNQLALLFIDLDFFKDINETLGYAEGDRLIVEASRRISACIRSTDIVSRQGGDEFAVALPLHSDRAHIEQVAQSLLGALAQPYTLCGQQVFVTASIGITVYPDDGGDISSLLKNADQALYAAKAAGRNQFSFFTQHMQQDAVKRMLLATDLRSAVPKGQLHVVYQPIVELATGAVHKAEALLRWTHPERGAISPAEFIPIAETSGSIVELGDWVLGQALAQVKVWRERLHPDFQISVNKSPVQFLRPPNGRQSWLERMQQLGLPGQAIAIEITEGMILESNSFVLHKLAHYQAYGVSISLDDFGTGYSSLSYLQRYPIGTVKIDKSFVIQLARQSKNWALCKAIIRMAHELGMKVVAEGVETEDQRAMLIEAECDYGQGYLFSRPLPSLAFEDYMARHNNRRPATAAQRLTPVAATPR